MTSSRPDQERARARRREFAPPVESTANARRAGVVFAVVAVVWALTTLGIIGVLASEHSRLEVDCPTADGWNYRDASWSWLPPGPVCHSLPTSDGRSDTQSPPSDSRYLMVVVPWLGLAATVLSARRWRRAGGNLSVTRWFQYERSRQKPRPIRVSWRARLGLDHPSLSAILSGATGGMLGYLYRFDLWLTTLIAFGFALIDLWLWRPHGRASRMNLARRDEALRERVQ